MLIDNFMFDHYIFKTALEYIASFFISALAALIFAFGFACFTTPADSNDFVLATGGVSGVSQIIALVVELITKSAEARSTIVSVGYIVLNIPLMVFSFFKIGKKFTVFTFINVILSSVFIKVFDLSGIAKTIAAYEINSNLVLSSIIVRVLFAGVCTGLSSALAYTGGISCGGIFNNFFYISVVFKR